MHDLFSYHNFVALSKEVQQFMKKQTWFDLHGYEFAMLFLRIGIFVAGGFVFSQVGWWFKVLGMVILSYGFYAVGITAIHETAHKSFVKSARINKALAYLFADFWGGLSSDSWFNSHVQVHHTVPNVVGEEPQWFYFPWLSKYLFFFVIPFLAVFWLFIQTGKFLWGRWGKLAWSWALFAAGFAFHTYLFSLFVTLPWAVACTLIMRSLFAPLFLHVSVFNHLGMENPRTRLPWLPLQTKTTRNLKPNWFLVVFGGNAFVQCHIEHHLFPAYSNHILKKIRPIVMKYLFKEGYVYAEETYGRCLRNCLKYYKDLFKVWNMQEYF